MLWHLRGEARCVLPFQLQLGSNAFLHNAPTLGRRKVSVQNSHSLTRNAPTYLEIKTFIASAKLFPSGPIPRFTWYHRDTLMMDYRDRGGFHVTSQLCFSPAFLPSLGSQCGLTAPVCAQKTLSSQHSAVESIASNVAAAGKLEAAEIHDTLQEPWACRTQGSCDKMVSVRAFTPVSAA